MALIFENDRQRYLNQMGVDVWYVRSPLPNAKTSPQPAFRKAGHLKKAKNPLDHIANISVEIASIKPDQASARSRKNQQEITSVAVQLKEPDKKVDDTYAAEKKADSASEFIWQQSELWIGRQFESRAFIAKVSMLSDNSGNALEMSLFNNIMSALDEPVKATAQREFYWPPFEQQLLPGQSVDIKQKLIQRWIEQMKGNRELFLFSDKDELVDHAVKATACPSLSSMLSNNQLKHKVWLMLEC